MALSNCDHSESTPPRFIETTFRGIVYTGRLRARGEKKRIQYFHVEIVWMPANIVHREFVGIPTSTRKTDNKKKTKKFGPEIRKRARQQVVGRCQKAEIGIWLNKSYGYV